MLVNLTSVQWKPTKGVCFTGLSFHQSTRYTYIMDPHGVPTAGDWALDRVAALYLQGTETALFDQCTFDRLGGTNVLMVSG
jgi:hypothetical protein